MVNPPHPPHSGEHLLSAGGKGTRSTGREAGPLTLDKCLALTFFLKASNKLWLLIFLADSPTKSKFRNCFYRFLVT